MAKTLTAMTLHREDSRAKTLYRKEKTAKTLYGEDYDREDFYREDSPAKTCPRILVFNQIGNRKITSC